MAKRKLKITAKANGPTLPSLVVASLQTARNLISDEENWGQLSLEDGGRYCLLGAVYEGSALVTYDLALTWDDRDDLEDRAQLHVEASIPLSQSITGFNDDPQRTHKQVLRVLDKAIKRAEKAAR